MMGVMTKYPHLRQLGRNTTPPASPDKALIETVPSPDPRLLYLVRFAAPEFTTLCAVTGQPDFAHLVIDYAPRAKLVESKSLKLYLGSFRNVQGFHEETTLAIGRRLVKELGPPADGERRDRKSTRLNSSHQIISYAVFCLKKKKNNKTHRI